MNSYSLVALLCFLFSSSGLPAGFLLLLYAFCLPVFGEETLNCDLPLSHSSTLITFLVYIVEFFLIVYSNQQAEYIVGT